MTGQISAAAPPGEDAMRWIPRVALALMLSALAWKLGDYAVTAWQALGFPYDLDYTEGIIWQQSALLLTERAYGPIDRYPFIVFEYPPVLLLLVRAGMALGLDALMVGRGVSILSGLGIVALVVLLVRAALPADSGRAAAFWGGLVAGLLLIASWPFAMWTVLMRVDTLAVALSLLGLFLCLRGEHRPGWMLAGALAFALAVYTKQTALAAPVATFAVLLCRAPRRAIVAGAIAFAVSLAALVAISLATDGGFLRHLVTYNANQMLAVNGVILVLVPAVHGILVTLTLLAVLQAWRSLRDDPALTLRRRIQGDARAALIAALLLYLLLATAMLPLVFKSGSSINYFLEWICLCVIFVGVLLGPLLAEAARAPRWSVPGGLFALLIAAQAAVIPTGADYRAIMRPAAREQLAALVARIAASPAPVLSDAMVLLLRAGKEVPIETFIFAELSRQGLWDERPYVEMIRRRAFGFLVLQNEPGDFHFDSRHTPAAAAAMREAYPRTERLGGYVLRLPPE